MAVVDESPSYVSLSISSSVSSFTSERRFMSSSTIGEIKGKLELITGATASLMQLQLYDEYGKLVCELENDEQTLGSYPVQNGQRLHVVDKDPSKEKGLFEDLSKVEKYEMSEEAYSKRQDSVLAFKKRMKVGRFAETDTEAKAAAEEQHKAAADAILVGSRCEVTLPRAAPKRGIVMFVGTTHFKPGYWVGVKYDEPLGKNDGSVGDHRYFECPPKYGAFVKPENVKTGDYPEETLLSDDEDEM